MKRKTGNPFRKLPVSPIGDCLFCRSEVLENATRTVFEAPQHFPLHLHRFFTPLSVLLVERSELFAGLLDGIEEHLEAFSVILDLTLLFFRLDRSLVCEVSRLLGGTIRLVNALPLIATV
jgi:hypothetical protein